MTKLLLDIDRGEYGIRDCGECNYCDEDEEVCSIFRVWRRGSNRVTACLDAERKIKDLISNLEEENAELKKDAEELAARRYLDIWAHVNTGTVSVKFSGEQGEEEIWESSGYEADFTASSPVELARKLGWKP